MSTFERLLLAVVLLVMSASAFGQVTTIRYPLMPIAGTYWDASRPGNGLLFDVGQGGFMFGAYYTFTQAGDSDWVAFQGQFVASTEEERRTTGIIGRLTTTVPLLSGTAGACLDCPQVAPVITTSRYGEATFTFFNTDRVRITTASFDRTLTRFLPDVDPASGNDDRISGTWRFVDVNDSTNPMFGRERRSGVVRFRPRTTQRFYFRAQQGLNFPVDDALTGEQYTINCQYASCPFGSTLIGGEGLDARDSRSTVVVRYPNGDWRVLSMCLASNFTTPPPNCETTETIDGVQVTRHLIQSTGLGRIDLYFTSAGMDRMVVRTGLASGNDHSLFEEKLFTRLNPDVFPLESNTLP